MLLRAVRPFARHPRVAQIVVAIPPAYAKEPPEWLTDVAGARLRVVAGGATRADSVRHALAALEPSCTIVLVHDAARPFVSHDTVEAVIATAATGVGAVPAVPVIDTLKLADGSMRVQRTVERQALWRAQTPQGFPRAMLDEVLAESDQAGATDEASMVEAAGHPVHLVPDHTFNIKVTTPDDFHLAEAIARS